MAIQYDAIKKGLHWSAFSVLISYAIFIAVGQYGVYEFDDKISYGGQITLFPILPAPFNPRMGYCMLGAASIIGASATDPFAWAKFNPDEMNPVLRGALIPCSLGTDSLMFTKEAGMHIGFLQSLPIWASVAVILGTILTIVAIGVGLTMRLRLSGYIAAAGLVFMSCGLAVGDATYNVGFVVSVYLVASLIVLTYLSEDDHLEALVDKVKALASGAKTQQRGGRGRRGDREETPQVLRRSTRSRSVRAETPASDSAAPRRAVRSTPSASKSSTKVDDKVKSSPAKTPRMRAPSSAKKSS